GPFDGGEGVDADMAGDLVDELGPTVLVLFAAEPLLLLFEVRCHLPPMALVGRLHPWRRLGGGWFYDFGANFDDYDPIGFGGGLGGRRFCGDLRFHRLYDRDRRFGLFAIGLRSRSAYNPIAESDPERGGNRQDVDGLLHVMSRFHAVLRWGVVERPDGSRGHRAWEAGTV
ncbi:hypothetical protein, partial [Pontiella sp.]|uniref:hypothetical protein n=1 Tax=Pontiella sp. TaxID=2837462 RepID=UPI0035672DB9